MKKNHRKVNQSKVQCRRCGTDKVTDQYKFCPRCRKIGRYHRSLYVDRHPEKVKASNAERVRVYDDGRRDYNKRWNKEHRDHVVAYAKERHKRFPNERRAWKLARKYGLTIEEYNQMVSDQDNRCAICDNTPSTKDLGHKLHIDHDHKTGKVRELLCSDCNKGLGHFHDDINKLQAAIRYIRRHMFMQNKGSEPFEKEPPKEKGKNAKG